MADPSVSAIKSVAPDMLPTTEGARKAGVELADLQGTWKLTYVWHPKVGWEPTSTPVGNFYGDTFLYSANGWEVEGDTVAIFQTLPPSGERLPLVSLPIQVAGNHLRIGSESDLLYDFAYTIRLQRDGQRLLVKTKSDNDEASVYHGFVRQ